MRKGSILFLLGGLVCVAGMIGCGGAAGDYPDTVPVSGTITRLGSPVAMAVVTFIPNEKGSPGTAVTDAQGNYTLMTFQPEDGAIPGGYKVTVTKTQVQKQGSAVGSPDDPDAAYLEMEDQGIDVTGGSAGDGTAASSQPDAVDLLPLKYKSRDTTDLTADVSKDKAVYDFELTE